jgi:SAM-dependent methyltransferase
MPTPGSTRFLGFYAREGARYDARRYGTRYGKLFRLLHRDILRDLLSGVTADSKVLEVACGTGHTTELLAEQGLHPVACDLTPEMMAQARARVGTASTFVRADAFHLPFADDAFDVVVCTRFLHLFSHAEQRVLIEEMRRVLKRRGQVVIDFDNFASRWLLAMPYVIYNVVRYRRLAPYAVYNRIRPTERMLRALGFERVHSEGVGGTHLLLAAFVSAGLAFRIGQRHRHRPLRVVAEQFVVRGSKTA